MPRPGRAAHRRKRRGCCGLAPNLWSSNLGEGVVAPSHPPRGRPHHYPIGETEDRSGAELCVRSCGGLEDRSLRPRGQHPSRHRAAARAQRACRPAGSRPTLSAAQVAAAAAPAPAPRFAPPAESPRPAPPPPRAARRAGPGRAGPGRGGTERPRLCAARRPQLGSCPSCTHSLSPPARSRRRLWVGFGSRASVSPC